MGISSTFNGNTINPTAQITGNLELIKMGAAKFTLASGSGNSFYGTTTILEGILNLGHPTSLQNSPLDTLECVPGDATNGLQTTATTLTLGGLIGDKNLASVFTTTSGGYGNLTALTLNPYTGATFEYSGVIANGAAGMTLSKTGAGKQILSGANTYTGATSISAGTLAIGANDVLPTTAVSIGNATLDAATFTDTIGTLDLTGPATIHFDINGKLAFASSNAIDWSNDIAGGGTLNITGTFVSGSSLRFGTNSTGLSSPQLARISAAGYIGFSLDANGYLTANAVNGYPTWAAANAGGQGADPDFDNDGVANGIEYILGGAGTTNDLAKLPVVSIAGGDLVFTFIRDQSSTDSTTTDIEVGTTLAAWPDTYNVGTTTANSTPGVTVAEDSPAGFDTITLTVPKGADPKKFAHLKVNVTP
jgi:autotransporter-associated beta strand protein